MLGIVIALKDETSELLKSLFQDNYVHNINNQKFYIVKTIVKESAVIVFSGVGKVNAAMAAAMLINNFKISKCINIGSAAAVNNLDILDVLLIDKVSFGDVDLTSFNYEINQMAKMPKEYETNGTLNNSIKNILIASNLSYKLGNCFTCDSFVNKDNLSKFNIASKSVQSVVDMECCAVAQVCYVMKIDFAAIKIVSDVIHNPLASQTQFQNNLAKIANIIDTLAYNIIQEITYSLIK